MFSHMNNPVYGVLIDSIVNDYLIRHCGYKVNKSAQAAIIANTYCDYFGSLHYPDTAECGLRVVKLGKASVTYEVGIFRQGEDDVKAVGGSTHVYVAQDPATGELGRVKPEGMPKEARQGYERLMERSARSMTEKEEEEVARAKAKL